MCCPPSRVLIFHSTNSSEPKQVEEMEDDGGQQALASGVIRSHLAFAEAAANGSRSTVEFLLESGADIDAPGRDGTTPLCAASLWGNDTMVTLLLERGANPRAQNEGTGWTALHAAAFQEHGKVVRILLEKGSDPKMADSEGRSAVDYASISEAIWPFFAAKGCSKSAKSHLLAKGIICKIHDQPEQGSGGVVDKYSNSISAFSRPGSSYTRAQYQPPVAIKRQGSLQSTNGRPTTGFVDPLGDEAPLTHRPSSNQRRPSLQGLAL